jgi:hypothetical protein
VAALDAAGFATIGSRRRGAPYFELAVVASRQPLAAAQMQALSASYLPE